MPKVPLLPPLELAVSSGDSFAPTPPLSDETLQGGSSACEVGAGPLYLSAFPETLHGGAPGWALPTRVWGTAPLSSHYAMPGAIWVGVRGI